MKMKKINKLKQFRKHQAKLSLMALAMSNLAHADLTSGLVAHYPFNGNANDVSGNGNNGTVNGATLTADRFGNVNSAYKFDGVDDTIIFTGMDDYFATNDFSITFYYETVAEIGQSIVGKRPICNHGQMIDIRGGFGGIGYELDDGIGNYFHPYVNVPQSGTILTAMVREGNTLLIYHNGVLMSEESTTNVANAYNTTPFGISNSPCIGKDGTNMFKGIIDELRVYNRALSQSEITELYTLKNPNTPLAPTCTSNAATNITINSATLNGNVISNGTTATANFEFGPTATYGTTVAAAPAQIYSSTPIAINANKTGLACNTTYHYRAKAVNSVGTGYGTDQSFTTQATCAHNTWLYPATPAVLVGKTFPLDIHVNSNNNAVGAYDYTVNFDPTKLLVDTAYQNAAATCEQGICPGTSALSASSVNVDNSSGNIRLTGFDTTGTGPGNDLQLLHMHFVAKNTPGATVVGLTTNELTNAVGEPLGSAATGATVTISTGLCGDSDGNASVNIVDALAISRYLVGLPPPPTVNQTLADVNRSGTVSIVDALHIARHAVGLVVTGTCAIGQPL